MLEFKNPWLQDPQRIRSTIEVPLKIRGEILRLEAKDGALQTTASILIDKFLHELTKLKLETGDRYGYQSAVLNCTITLNDANGKPIEYNSKTGETRPVAAGGVQKGGLQKCGAGVEAVAFPHPSMVASARRQERRHKSARPHG